MNGQGMVTAVNGTLPAAERAKAGWARWVWFQFIRWTGQVYTFQFEDAHVMAGFILLNAPGPHQVVFYRERWPTRQVHAVAGYRIFVRWQPATWRDTLPAGAMLKPILRTFIQVDGA